MHPTLQWLKNWFSRNPKAAAHLVARTTPRRTNVQYIRIDSDTADKLRVLRSYPEEARKQARSQLFKAIKLNHHIPATSRIKINIENDQHEMFMVVCDKATGQPWCYNDANYKQPYLLGAVEPASEPEYAAGEPLQGEELYDLPAPAPVPEVGSHSTKRFAAIDVALVRRLVATSARLLTDDQLVGADALPHVTTRVPLADGMFVSEGKVYIERPAS